MMSDRAVLIDPHPCPLPLNMGRETHAEKPVFWSPSPFLGGGIKGGGRHAPAGREIK